MNCSGVAPNGRSVRYAALGEVSGDDGGGGWLGQQAVRSAVRGHDGRDQHERGGREDPPHSPRIEARERRATGILALNEQQGRDQEPR